jgi:hypothetical protein
LRRAIEFLGWQDHTELAQQTLQRIDLCYPLTFGVSGGQGSGVEGQEPGAKEQDLATGDQLPPLSWDPTFPPSTSGVGDLGLSAQPQFNFNDALGTFPPSTSGVSNPRPSAQQQDHLTGNQPPSFPWSQEFTSPWNQFGTFPGNPSTSRVSNPVSSAQQQEHSQGSSTDQSLDNFPILGARKPEPTAEDQGPYYRKARSESM